MANIEVDDKFSSKLMDAILENIETRWAEFEHIFDPIKVTDLRGNLFVSNKLTTFHLSALAQAEETFCDFLGIRIFAESYFYAYSYLISPGTTYERSLEYPKGLTRIENMIFAARESECRIRTR